MKDIARWREKARFAELAGRRLAYWSTKDDAKPTLLLIHGYPTSSWDWSAIWPDLKKHFRLVAMDMLGFGLSEKPRDIRYSLLYQADLQEALLEQLGIGEAHILAHDYGDTVAQELLARHNENALSFFLKSVCFLNGGLFPERHRALPIQKFGLSPLGPLLGLMMSRAKLRQSFDQIFGAETKASDAEIDGHWELMRESGGAGVMHKLLQYIPERIEHRDRWVGALKGARAPLKLIDGGADPVSGAPLYHYYLEQISNPDATLLEAIGHYPQTEAPAGVARLFLDFHRKIGTIS